MATIGCGGAGQATSNADARPTTDINGGACEIQVAAAALEPAMHVPACSKVTHKTMPPSSGMHYPSWPVFRVYDQPVPWGFLVHGLEHGAVVIAYHCADGCPDQVLALKTLVATLPTKEGCNSPPVIVTPDPTLDVPFAASAWGYTLRAKCFDADRFATFVKENANHGPEYWGTDCGSVDLESTGWCPATPP